MRWFHGHKYDPVAVQHGTELPNMSIMSAGGPLKAPHTIVLARCKCGNTSSYVMYVMRGIWTLDQVLGKPEASPDAVADRFLATMKEPHE
jgi:hypothetical protein